MRFSPVAALFIPVLSAAAGNNILVTVGGNNLLAFSPTNITAEVGDTVTFQFQSKNHSVTQSTFATPCEIQTTPAQGIDSGFQPVPTGSTELPQWSFTMDNASTPLWFFCAQTIPADHCQMGMVFSVNANPDSAKSFAVYQAAAMSGGGAPLGGAPPPAGSDPAASIAASVGDDATSDAASLGSEATSFGASVFGDATSVAGGFGSEATAVGASIIGDATGAAGNVFSSVVGGASNPSATPSASGNGTGGGQTGAGLRLERSASLPVLAAIGLAGVLLL
jgi:hypothetical protein